MTDNAELIKYDGTREAHYWVQHLETPSWLLLKLQKGEERFKKIFKVTDENTPPNDWVEMVDYGNVAYLPAWVETTEHYKERILNDYGITI